MGNKPIKRNENIVKLSKDHHASLLFCWKIRQGIKYHIGVERLIKYVQYFWKHHFSLHFKEEEDFLFAPLKDEVVQKAIDDHLKIKSSIEQLTGLGTENKEILLSNIAEMVDQHVRFEERVLFPYLEQKLSVKQLEEIGNQIKGDPLMDHYEDNFWTKSSSL